MTEKHHFASVFIRKFYDSHIVLYMSDKVLEVPSVPVFRNLGHLITDCHLCVGSNLTSVKC